MLVDASFYEIRTPGNRVIFDLADGRSIEVPIEWFPLLRAAPKDARSDYEISDDGGTVAWPKLGERISVAAVMIAPKVTSCQMVPMPGNASRGGVAVRGQQFTHTLHTAQPDG